MEFHLLHLYPDLMNLYGSYANVRVLEGLLGRLGHTVITQTVQPGETPDLTGVDFLYSGAGTERRARFAMEALSSWGDSVRKAAEDGCTLLFAGTAMELLGRSVTTAAGETFSGLGVGTFSTVQGARRIVGDVLGHTELFPEAVAGFMNKCGVISDVETPLLTTLSMGWGNEAERGPEGFHQGNVYASELTGPILVKNPRLLEAVAAGMFRHRGAPLPEAWPVDQWAQQGWAVTVRELSARKQERHRKLELEWRYPVCYNQFIS